MVAPPAGSWAPLTASVAVAVPADPTSTACPSVVFPDAKVTQCVLGRVRGLRFPRPNGGGVVNVKYPFVFKAAT